MNNLIEALDAGGVPRLRVAAPQLIDSTGTVREASLSLAGLWADRSLESPVGRPPADPCQDLHRHCVVGPGKPSAILR